MRVEVANMVIRIDGRLAAQGVIKGKTYDKLGLELICGALIALEFSEPRPTPAPDADSKDPVMGPLWNSLSMRAFLCSVRGFKAVLEQAREELAEAGAMDDA